MIRASLLASAALALALVRPAPAQTAQERGAALVHAAHVASGGDRWNTVAALRSSGRVSSDGLDGDTQTVMDLRSGRYAEHQRNGLFATAEGRDDAGHWRQDNSGLLHALDSREAQTVAATEDWVSRGLLVPGRFDAVYRRLDDITDNGHRYQRLQAVPHGGRAVEVWIDPATHLPERAVWKSSFQTVTQRYGDYRTVDGLTLPFKVITATGSADNAATETIARYVPLARLPGDALKRPDGRVRDVDMTDDAARAVTRLRVEDGVVLVDAKIDGKGPFPFILDTGGHAILFADTAKRLGLSTQGGGVSYGSGPGSMSTAYTRVASTSLGAARIHDLPYLVMPFPFAFYDRGTQRPIAGILGLEIFERFAVTYDYDGGRLVLQPFDAGTPPPPGRGQALPLRFTDDMPLTEARVDGHAGIFGIDTGNSAFTLIFPQWAAREGIAARYAKGAPRPTGGVGGMYIAHIAHARSVELGPLRADDPVVMLTRKDAGATGNPTEAGNIGQDILSRFIVHFDYRRQRMYLAPRARPVAPAYTSAGMLFVKTGGDRTLFHVGWVAKDGPAAQAGVKKGDAIVALDGEPVRRLGRFQAQDMIAHRPPGSHLRVKLKDGRELDLVLRDRAAQ